MKIAHNEWKTLDGLGRANLERDTKSGIITDREGKTEDAKSKEQGYVGKYKKLPKKKKRSPWWRDGAVDKSLANLKGEKLEKFINEGEK